MKIPPSIAVAFILLFFFPFISVHAQVDSTAMQKTKDEVPKVFINCPFCDIEYIKNEISFVNYVRAMEDAEINILITQQSTGSGGMEYTLLFEGQRRFAFMNDILNYSSQPNNSDETTRAGLTQILRLGLMRYIAKTSMSQQVKVDIGNEDKKETGTPVEDKWKSWIFEIVLGGYLSGEEAYKSSNFWTCLSANKITPKWKIETRIGNDYYEGRYSIGNETVQKLQRYLYFYNQTVKSLGEHWSIGGRTEEYSYDYSNIRFSANNGPALEYNIFPYSKSTRRQLRFLYSVGHTYNSYIDTTIFNKVEENLFREKLQIAFEMKEIWGSISASLIGSNYFHDFTKNRMILNASLNVKITKNLAFNLSGSFNLIHDQIALPKQDATSEEILLQQRQLATQYSYWTNIGFTYTFGAIYNNVVNPRFN